MRKQVGPARLSQLNFGLPMSMSGLASTYSSQSLSNKLCRARFWINGAVVTWNSQVCTSFDCIYSASENTLLYSHAPVQ